MASAAVSAVAVGLSPRGRGKRVRPTRDRALLRSIPAWAGETPTSLKAARSNRVYPRVGGGNHLAANHTRRIAGLSPRGRGKPVGQCIALRTTRSIPAWAGETTPVERAERLHEVYPRVGGGNLAASMSPASTDGLSPRGRGKRRIRVELNFQLRSIPAWAGETISAYERVCRGRVYPRVGGGNLYATRAAPQCCGLSPRGRGKHFGYAGAHNYVRSIPAWAGETGTPVASAQSAAVYPRVGGGNS